MKALASIMLLMLLFSFQIYAQPYEAGKQSLYKPGDDAHASCSTIVSVVLHGFPHVFAHTAESNGSSPTVSLTPPLRYSNLMTGEIKFNAGEEARFQCSLDGSAYMSCTSPFGYSGLANGQHIFSIIATDIAGNSCAPINYTWTVNTALAASSMILLPQTGQASCYNSDGIEIACQGTGQDMDTLTGVPWPNPRFNDNNNGTITDNLTGLVWLRDANCFGYQNWVNALNRVKNLSNGQCGLADGSIAGEWRLPTVNELESLVDLQACRPPLPNGHPFTNIQAEDYWSSNTYACEPTCAWYVWLSDGYVGKAKSKFYEFPVWAVRSATLATSVVQLPCSGQLSCYDNNGALIPCVGSGQDGELKPGLSWPAPRFSDNGDETMTDNLTGLIWSKNSSPAITWLFWQDALDYIKTLNTQNWLGHNDWRLPNRKELMSLMNREQASNAIWLTNQGFPNVLENLCCWSSSTYIDNTAKAWNFDMQSGSVYGAEKIWEYSNVWPVRGGYIQQKLSVTKVGSGTITPSKGTLDWVSNIAVARIAPGDTVSLTAIPDAGFRFTGWSGACTGNSNCTVTMNEAKNVTAIFSVLPSAEPPSSLMVLTRTTTNGKVSLVCGMSATRGAVYTFEYSKDGGKSWAKGYTGESRKTAINLKEPGVYQFRVSATATGFTPSVSKAGDHTCIFKPDDTKHSHTH